MIDEFYSNLALKGVRDSFQKAFGVPGEGLLRRHPENACNRRSRPVAQGHAFEAPSQAFA